MMPQHLLTEISHRIIVLIGILRYGFLILLTCMFYNLNEKSKYISLHVQCTFSRMFFFLFTILSFFFQTKLYVLSDSHVHSLSFSITFVSIIIMLFFASSLSLSLCPPLSLQCTPVQSACNLVLFKDIGARAIQTQRVVSSDSSLFTAYFTS